MISRKIIFVVDLLILILDLTNANLFEDYFPLYPNYERDYYNAMSEYDSDEHITNEAYLDYAEAQVLNELLYDVYYNEDMIYSDNCIETESYSDNEIKLRINDAIKPPFQEKSMLYNDYYENDSIDSKEGTPILLLEFDNKPKYRRPKKKDKIKVRNHKNGNNLIILEDLPPQLDFRNEVSKTNSLQKNNIWDLIKDIAKNVIKQKERGNFDNKESFRSIESSEILELEVDDKFKKLNRIENKNNLSYNIVFMEGTRKDSTENVVIEVEIKEDPKLEPLTLQQQLPFETKDKEFRPSSPWLNRIDSTGFEIKAHDTVNNMVPKNDGWGKENFMLKREQDNRANVLRQGMDCMKLLVRKCYWAVRAANKAACKKTECGQVFMKHLAKAARTGCIKYFVENPDDCRRATVDTACACLEACKREKQRARTGLTISILRDKFEDACQTENSRQCVGACYYSMNGACAELGCTVAKKTFLKSFCEPKCKQQFSCGGGGGGGGKNKDSKSSDSGSASSGSSSRTSGSSSASGEGYCKDTSKKC